MRTFTHVKLPGTVCRVFIAYSFYSLTVRVVPIYIPLRNIIYYNNTWAIVTEKLLHCNIFH